MPTLELETRRAPLSPSSFNAEARTIEAVISTGADVQRRDARGPFVERLDISGINAADLAGIPVLDGHRQGGSEHVVGVVTAARHEGGALVATIMLSDTDDVRSIVRKVELGVMRAVSIGYALTNITEKRDASGRRIRTAIPIIREVSLVAIAADAASHIRSGNTVEDELEQTITLTRAETNAQIRSIAETAGLNRTWADAQIDAEADVASATAAAFAAMQERSAPNGTIRAHITTDHTDPAAVIERRAEALFAQATGETPSEAARPFMTHTLMDHARACVAGSGARVDRMSGIELVRDAMGTSDFPLILDNTANRTVRHGYAAAESPLKIITKRRPMKDFRPMNVLEVGADAELHETTEHGEVKTISLAETGESVRLTTYTGKIALTRAALINDDIGAFADMSLITGRLAAEKEARLLSQALIGAPKMRDGKALFHVDHANLAAGSVLSVESLSAARQSLRTKTGLDGQTPANVTPKFLVVGAALETAAEQLLATLAATKSDDVNPFAGKLQLVVDARIPGNQWYVIADPATAPVFEFLFLSSAPGPQVETRERWDTLGREWRVILDAGVGVTDTRGAYRNPGA